MRILNEIVYFLWLQTSIRAESDTNHRFIVFRKQNITIRFMINVSFELTDASLEMQ